MIWLGPASIQGGLLFHCGDKPRWVRPPQEGPARFPVMVNGEAGLTVDQS